MAGNNFTNQWNNQALQAKRLENVVGYDYNTQTRNIIATDITVPFDVNWNTPEYGNQFCGGIRIGKTSGNELQPLQVVLAGSSSPSTFLVKTGDFLNVQATSILTNPEILDERIINIVVYMGQAAEQPFEPFYNNLFQPYYNFDVVADWYGLLGIGNPTQSDFENWLTGGLGFLPPSVLEGYICEPIINDISNGIFVGRIKCRLEIDCKGNNWRLDDYFYEINGLGDFYGCKAINIKNNNQVIDYPQLNLYFKGLKEINFKYYSQINSEIQFINFDSNIYVENIDLSFLQFCTDGNFIEFSCANNPLVSEFLNFVLMPDSTINFVMSNMYGFRRFEYDLTNTNISNFTFNNNSSFTPDGAQRLGLEYINTSLLPDTIQALDLSNNNLNVMTAGYTKFPTGLINLQLNNNAMVNFNPECQLPFTLQSLQLSSNLLYEFDIKYALPNGLSNIYLANNLIQSFNTTCNVGLFQLDLANNQLTKANFFNLLNTSLYILNLSQNAFSEFVVNAPLPTSLNVFYLNDNFISKCLLQGTTGPVNIFLYNNRMTVDSWTEMNTWATGITASAPGSKQIYAYANPGSISASPTNATLISKGYTVYP